MGISKRVYQRLRLIGYSTVPDFFCYSTKIANFEESSHHYPLLRPNPSQTRTIPRPTPTFPKTALSPSLFVMLTSVCTYMLSHPHYPSPRTTFLPPLSKGGGLTARHKLLSCRVLLATHPPFLFTKLFCRQDGGIAFLLHPFRLSDTSVNNPSIVGSASHCNRSSPLHKGAKGDSALPTLPKPHYPLALHQHPCHMNALLVSYPHYPTRFS